MRSPSSARASASRPHIRRSPSQVESHGNGRRRAGHRAVQCWRRAWTDAPSYPADFLGRALDGGGTVVRPTPQGRCHLPRMVRRAPNHLPSSRRRRCRLPRAVFMERGRSKSCSRACGAQFCARLAQSVSACPHLWNSVELCEQREGTHAIETCNRVVRWRNLAMTSP